LNSLNLLVIEGNIVKDPVFRQTPKGTMIAAFSIASNRYYRNGEEMEQETSFFEVEAWGRLAENCQTLAHKGRGCRVTGRMKQERWNGPDGSPRSKVIVVADKIEYNPERRENS
jgi:single-strand DNA-binding protein